jgi:uncharacterized damage-inducible protein DinB
MRKKLFLAAVMVAVGLFGGRAWAQEAAAERMSKEELFAHLKESRQKFLDSIRGVSEEQWKFKPAADRWSIAEVAEHITVTEQFFVQMIREQMLGNLEAAKRPEGPGISDRKFLAMIVDRSQPAQAPEMLAPQNKFAGQAELVEAFEAIRKEMTKLAKETPEGDLRSRYMKFPSGHVIDAQQVVLLAAAHALRHTAQIEEVKAQAGYPGAQMSKGELLRYLEKTRQKFLDSLEGLSEEQWKFKPAAERWSVAEVAEHVTLSESFLLNLAQGVLQNPEAITRPEGEGLTDAALLARLTDRSWRAQSPEPGQPTGKWASRAEMLQAFEDAYSGTMRTAREADKDVLRARWAATPLGVLDAHQVLLLLAAHRARHTLQIEEVKAHTGFPK